MEWTDERVGTLKGMWLGGYTARQIAERLGGVSRNAVIGKAHRLGLSTRPSPIRRHEPLAAPRSFERTCQWPIGDPGSADFRFCGEEAVSGKPYCESHCNVAYRRTSSSAPSPSVPAEAAE